MRAFLAELEKARGRSGRGRLRVCRCLSGCLASVQIDKPDPAKVGLAGVCKDLAAVGEWWRNDGQHGQVLSAAGCRSDRGAFMSPGPGSGRATPGRAPAHPRCAPKARTQNFAVTGGSYAPRPPHTSPFRENLSGGAARGGRDQRRGMVGQGGQADHPSRTLRHLGPFVPQNRESVAPEVQRIGRLSDAFATVSRGFCTARCGEGFCALRLSL